MLKQVPVALGTHILALALGGGVEVVGQNSEALQSLTSRPVLAVVEICPPELPQALYETSWKFPRNFPAAFKALTKVVGKLLECIIMFFGTTVTPLSRETAKRNTDSKILGKTKQNPRKTKENHRNLENHRDPDQPQGVSSVCGLAVRLLLETQCLSSVMEAVRTLTNDEKLSIAKSSTITFTEIS